MNLSEKIVMHRKSAGLSQEELAEKLNLSRQAVSRWESGTAMPDAGNILQLSKLFDVTADYLLNDAYQSDADTPKVRALQGNRLTQIALCLIAVETMALLLLFVTTFLLQNMVLAWVCFLPFIAVQAAFACACRRNPSTDGGKSAIVRRRFYKISAWLGLYFPIRFAVSALAQLYPRPYSTLIMECIVLILYVATSVLVCLMLDKKL
ncbi:helix-turn-helix transcriptional regulator [uncultured Gemmiger sp.]|uniref:helix-turn-helix domain-containing protein n=1 Tax=uncultured Gemmiger sp. TaxID=1623490 RepID=UPI0025CF3847|nr:helix-turn-helix transcriptional regulator [uncultured Gemmiger sp.]